MSVPEIIIYVGFFTFDTGISNVSRVGVLLCSVNLITVCNCPRKSVVVAVLAVMLTGVLMLADSLVGVAIRVATKIRVFTLADSLLFVLLIPAIDTGTFIIPLNRVCACALPLTLTSTFSVASARVVVKLRMASLIVVLMSAVMRVVEGARI